MEGEPEPHRRRPRRRDCRPERDGDPDALAMAAIVRELGRNRRSDLGNSMFAGIQRQPMRSSASRSGSRSCAKPSSAAGGSAWSAACRHRRPGAAGRPVVRRAVLHAGSDDRRDQPGARRDRPDGQQQDQHRAIGARVEGDGEQRNAAIDALQFIEMSPRRASPTRH